MTAQDPNMSVEDYTNSVDPSEMEGTVKVADTMPDSPTSTAGASQSGLEANGAEGHKACTTTVLALFVVVCVVLVATGLGVGFGLDAFGLKSSSAAATAPEVPTTESPTTTTPPSLSPTWRPSFIPSDLPSLQPSLGPSLMPSVQPSANPSTVPTPAPTKAYYPMNPEPSSPPSEYFNYDPNSPYGPDNWARVDTSQHWLLEYTSNGFGIWDGYHSEDLTLNICNGPTRKQSPKDLISTIPCEATHEIRTECANYPLSNDDYMAKLILPHKLSIEFKRRPCLVLNNSECLEDAPPMADYPRYASGDLNIEAYSDMQHFDIKVPAEHTINGETFDAEIQMFHVSLEAPRLSSLGILIRADDGFDNADYQIVLSEFQAEYDLHALECAQKRHRQRRMSLRGAVDDETVKTLDTDEETDDEDVYSEQIQKIKEARKLQWTTSNFNPYSDNFMTTMFFFRYDGSITEPPCRDITWWVMDKPMRISHRQLEWTKKILFSHVDSNCVATSVHNGDQSVARPIFELGEEREMQHCSDGAFRSDADKGRPPGRQCRS